MEPISEARLAELIANQDGRDYHKVVKDATMAANVNEQQLTEDLDKGEWVVITHIGTNGGYNVNLQLKNKDKVLIGQEVNGINAPLNPKTWWYALEVPMLFDEGDEPRLYGKATVAATNIKFFWHGIGNK